MNHIRFLQNIELEITHPETDTVTEQYFMSGVYAKVNKLVKRAVEEEYGTFYDVYLDDGNQIIGISAGLFEIVGNVPIEEEVLNEQSPSNLVEGSS